MILVSGTSLGANIGSESIEKFYSLFSTNCSIVGTQTRDAKNAVDGIVNILKTLESDSSCKSLAGAVNDLNLISRQIQFIEQPVNINEKLISSMESRKRELLLVLSQNISDSEAKVIQMEIKGLQLSLAEQRANQNGDFQNEIYNQRLRATQSIVASTQAIFAQLSANEKCWVNNPGLLQNFAGFSLAVGQSLAFGAHRPENVLFLGAGLNLISAVVDYFYKQKVNSRIQSFGSGIEATALTCAMETLSNQYCEAKDSEMAIERVAQALTDSPSSNEVWGSIRLLERELPNMTEWLELVMAGSNPSNSSSARQRQEIYIKEEKMKSTLDFVQGLVAEKKKFIDSLAEPQKKWIEIKSIVTEISNRINPLVYTGTDVNVANPLSKRFSKDNGAYFLIGFADPPVILNNIGTSVLRMPITFDSFDPFGTEHAQFRTQLRANSAQIILDNFRIWYRDTYEVLMAEKSRVLIEDPVMVFAKAYPRTSSGNQKGLSPRHSIIKILEFLRSNKNTSFSQGSLQIILNDTISRLEEISMQIDSVVINNADPEATLNKITQTAKLDKGSGFLRARVEFFVKTLLEEMILQSPFQDSKNLQLLAANDVVQYLKQYSGAQSLQKMMDDSKNAQSLTAATMLRFMETFKDPIESSIGYYDGLIQTFGKVSSSSHYRSKAILCLNLAAMPNVSIPNSFSSCMGLKVNSVFSNGPSSIQIQKGTMSMSFDSRVCHYRDYHRRSAIFNSLLETGNPVSASNVTSIELNPVKVILPTYEKAQIKDECKTAEAWKTNRNPYCEQDWWDGCDRSYSSSCESVNKRSGLFRFFGN